MSKNSRLKHFSQRRQWVADPMGGLSLIGAAYVRGDNVQPLADEQVTDIKLTSWIAYANMTTNQNADVDDWAMIASSLNIALMLVEDGYGIEHQEQFNRALEGISRAWVRHQNTQKWRFDGLAINDIRDALELHDQQCALVTKGDIKRAMIAVKERIEAGHVYEIEEVAA